jgi:hypothetical protein
VQARLTEKGRQTLDAIRGIKNYRGLVNEVLKQARQDKRKLSGRKQGPR